jgi:hypothetical protein
MSDVSRLVRGAGDGGLHELILLAEAFHQDASLRESTLVAAAILENRDEFIARTGRHRAQIERVVAGGGGHYNSDECLLLIGLAHGLQCIGEMIGMPLVDLPSVRKILRENPGSASSALSLWRANARYVGAVDWGDWENDLRGDP